MFKPTEIKKNALNAAFGLILTLLTPVTGAWAFSSPFPAVLPEINIPNSQPVSTGINGSPLLIRGSQPKGDEQLDQLIQYGVERILILKSNNKKNEIKKEILALSQRGINQDDILQMNFPWRNVEFNSTCKMVVKALQFLQESERLQKKTYFHCTAGEDRTGMISALLKLSRETNIKENALKLFQTEMCDKGYEHGNPKKPDHVVCDIRQGLTPVFAKMLFLLSNYAELSESHCNEMAISAHSIYQDQFQSFAQLNCDESTQLQVAKPRQVICKKP